MRSGTERHAALNLYAEAKSTDRDSDCAGAAVAEVNVYRTRKPSVSSRDTWIVFLGNGRRGAYYGVE